MQLDLNVMLNRVPNSDSYIYSLASIHEFIIKTSTLGEDFRRFLLKGDTLEEAMLYTVPANFADFVVLLKEQGEFIPFKSTCYILGLWNGHQEIENSISAAIVFMEDEGSSLSHSISLQFSFIVRNLHEYHEKKAVADKIVSLATSMLSFKYATFYDLEYVSSFEDHRPELYTGGILYCNPKIINQLEGFKRPLSSDLIELAALNEPLDLDNSEHIKKNHAFEKMLLKNKDFRQLIQR